MDAETLEQKMKELVVAITERLESSTDKGIIDSATNKINLIIDELDSETTEKSSITVSTKVGIFATQKTKKEGFSAPKNTPQKSDWALLCIV